MKKLNKNLDKAFDIDISKLGSNKIFFIPDINEDDIGFLNIINDKNNRYDKLLIKFKSYELEFNSGDISIDLYNVYKFINTNNNDFKYDYKTTIKSRNLILITEQLLNNDIPDSYNLCYLDSNYNFNLYSHLTFSNFNIKILLIFIVPKFIKTFENFNKYYDLYINNKNIGTYYSIKKIEEVKKVEKKSTWFDDMIRKEFDIPIKSNIKIHEVLDNLKETELKYQKEHNLDESYKEIKDDLSRLEELKEKLKTKEVKVETYDLDETIKNHLNLKGPKLKQENLEVCYKFLNSVFMSPVLKKHFDLHLERFKFNTLHKYTLPGNYKTIKEWLFNNDFIKLENDTIYITSSGTDFIKNNPQIFKKYNT